MTDRVSTLTVVLSKDMRIDDVEVVKQAVSMIRGVLKVENGPVTDYADLVARERIQRELQERVFQALDPERWEIVKKSRLT
jgi:hypothetical protein